MTQHDSQAHGSRDSWSEARWRRELAALAYADAWEAGDLDALARLWDQAKADVELERVLCDLSEGLAEEEERKAEPSPGWNADAAKVRALLDRHLPSSRPPAPPSGPLTAGDVAARIAGDPALLSKLAEDERQINARLVADQTPLPPQMGIAPLERWAAGLPVKAGPAYWRVFRHVAVLLTMGRGHQAGLLMAARQASRPKPPQEPPGDTGGGQP